jgi:hypothetical protein
MKIMNKYLEEAKSIRASINDLAKDASDEKLLNNKAAFPFWNDNNVKYDIGENLQYKDKLYQVIQTHNSQATWAPDIVPALFKEISLEEWPDWKQPTGAHDAYAKGDKCSHNGKHWVSNIDSNVWEPGVTGWDEVE